MAFTQFMESISLLEALNDALRYGRLRQVPAEAGEIQSDVDRLKREQSYCCGERV